MPLRVRLRSSLACAALVAGLAAASGPALAGEPAAATSQAAPTAALPAMSAADLDARIAPLEGKGAPARANAAKALAELGPEAVPAIAKKLAALREEPSGPIRAALKDANGRAGADLCEALLASKKTDGPGYAHALVTSALLRALAHAGTTPAARQLVEAAADHGGAFQPQIARELRTLGDYAVPALLEARAARSPHLRHWAAAQLEAMGKRMPGDAVQIANKDNQILADVLHAYGSARDMDALPVILSFVSSDRVPVRAAAREAVLRFGQEAVWKLREAYANVAGKPAPDGWTAAETAKQLFAAHDRIRLQEVYGLLDEGLAANERGDVDAAVAAFDKVLARQPMLDRRAETAPAYLAYARKLEADPARAGDARAALEKALRLAPDGARVPQIRAELAYLEGEDLLARGIQDPAPFERALADDPAHAKARAELDRMTARAEDTTTSLRAWAGGGAVLFAGILAAILFGGRRRARAARA